MLASLMALAGATPAIAADCPTGLFVAAAGPDTASALLIGPDGQFRYMLSEGAIDEAAEGRWTCTGDTLLLTTLPAPTPPAFDLVSVAASEDGSFSLVITWPDGPGIAGVDFELTLDDGEQIRGYTQTDGWSRDMNGRKVRSVRVFEPYYGTVSPPMPLPDDANARVHIMLTPNDMGIAAFRDTPVTIENDRLVLHWRERSIPYTASNDD